MNVERKKFSKIVRRIMIVEVLLSLALLIIAASFMPDKMGESTFLILIIFNIVFWPLSILVLVYNYSSVTTSDSYKELVASNKERSKERELYRKEHPELYEDEPKELSVFKKIIILLSNRQFRRMLIPGVFYFVGLVVIITLLIMMIFS